MADELADALADANAAILALQAELAVESIKSQEGRRLAKAAEHAASALVSRGQKGDVLPLLAAAEDAARV
jgi:hypothetical protein